MSDFELPVAFSFELSFGGISGDAAFKDASGIAMESNVEEVTCGGENRFKYRLPGIRKFNNLVLKRGFMAGGTGLEQWISDTMTNGLNTIIKPKEIMVSLLDSSQKPQAQWSFVNAYPIKWNVSDFDSMKNELVIESIEFAYNYFEKK